MKQHFIKLLFIMLCCMMGNVAFGHDFEATHNGKTIYYKITSSTADLKTVAVTFRGDSYNYSSEYSGRITIPTTVDYEGTTYSVTKIGRDAFRDCSLLTSVVIPNSVIRIEETAFAGCSSLADIDISDSVIQIGRWAFSDTAWFDEQPNGVVYVGKVAYVYKGTMSSGTELVLKGGTLGIGDYAFYRGLLKSIVIPNSVKYIGKEAFSTTTLTSINIPNSVTEMGELAFEHCDNLKSVVIGNGITTISNNAFSWCSNLSSVKIPDSVTKIGGAAFMGCKWNLTSVYIPNSVTEISGSAFEGCTYLSSINIPNSVTTIGSYAFYGCSRLTSVTIPNSVESIGESTFEGCSGLTSVTIGNGVKSFGTNVFKDCQKLSDIHYTPRTITISKTILSLISSTDRTLYLHMTTANESVVAELVSSYSSRLKKIIVVEDTTVVDDSYDLTVSNVGISTLYLNFTVDIPDDDNLLDVFYVNKIDGNIMLLKKISKYIPARTAVIILANPGTFTFFSTNHEVESITQNKLNGVLEDTPVSSIDGTVYTLGRGVNTGYFGFHKFTGTTIPANKAFLVRNASSGVNSFNLVLDNEDGTSTAIGRIENGELIPENSAIYDLQGRRVENPSKGIYIVNGKKQYIK